MKIVIDLVKLEKKNLTINQYLLLLKIYYQIKEEEIPFIESKSDYLSLRDSGFLIIEGPNVTLQRKAINLIEGGSERDYEDLAEKIRDMFPKGLKAGQYPWRSTVKDLSQRLKSLDKNFGMTEFDDEIILKTTENYVRGFSARDMDAGMQLCKYFINKDGSSTLMDLLQAEEPTEITSRGFIKRI